MLAKNQPVGLYKKIVLSFIAFTIILVFLILYLSFSYAQITIIPSKKVVSSEFIIDVMENPEIEGVLSGKIMETTVEGEKKFLPTGGKEEEGQARGTVTIFNNHTSDQPLVRTTRLLTPEGLLFRLDKLVTVPAGGKAEVAVYADANGKQYDIAPTKFTIPGLRQELQSKIYAESFATMSGGVKQIKVLSEADIERGKNELASELYEQGIAQLSKDSLSGEVSRKLTFKEIIEATTDVTPGEEVGEFTIDMKLKVVGLSIDEVKLLSLAETKMKNMLPADQKLVNVNLDSLNYTLEKYDLKTGTANLKVYLEGETVLKDTSIIFNKDNLVGRNKKEAEAYLQSFDAIKEAMVDFSPFWVTKVPSLKDHIKIEIK